MLDIGRLATGSAGGGYVVVFIVDAALFLASATLAWRIGREGALRGLRPFGRIGRKEAAA